MKPIAIFYHAHFFKDSVASPRQHGFHICQEQWQIVKDAGLEEAATEIHCGINGGDESKPYGHIALPAKATVYYQGLDAKSETPTVARMWEFAKDHPGWYILYFHNKGASHVDPNYLAFVRRWRRCMETALIVNWRQCMRDLEFGFESVGCHWMVNVGVPPIDNIWGGNFWWATSDFLSTLSDIRQSDYIKRYGVNHPTARYEGERWIGSGPRLPVIKDYHVNGIGACP